MKILITGSSGLIGGEAVEYFDSLGHTVVGLDNNMRREFFGEAGDTLWNMNRIFHKAKNFTHMPVDIRDQDQMYDVFYPEKSKPYTGPFDAVIHCAAQPSHDKAREIPMVDHSVNVAGTMMALEMTRKHSPNAVFIYMSTNKVYGDAPNEMEFAEYNTRYDWFPEEWKGFDEDTRIDQSTHSIFGANKLAADIMVQEYAKTYGMKTCVLRGGCLTGPGHSGVELHGFLSYLVRTAIAGKPYTIYGYKGKQVRDNIHSYDVVRAMEEIIKDCKPGGQVYNLGGGRANSTSILEAICTIENKIGKKIKLKYVDEPRLGDHICYISDTSKFQRDYPNWKITRSLDQTLDEMIQRCYWDMHCNEEETLNYPLTKDSLVMDVGGYRGTWTADIVGRYDCHALIFEPDLEFFTECVRRFKDNPKVKVFNFGLSDKTETVQLAKQGMNTSAFRGNSGQAELPNDRVFGEAVLQQSMFVDIAELLTTPLIIGVDLPNVDLISINCEGGEYPILNRLIDTGLISRFKNVQVQFHSFYPDAVNARMNIRGSLSETHKEKFCFTFVWESWERK